MATGASAFPAAGPYTGRLALGQDHTCALQSDGSVDCWGWNSRGQAEDHPGPFVQITAGTFHNCGLYADGTAECWGDNGNGQTDDQPGTFLQVEAGDSFTCGLRPDRDVHCWGKNNLGQTVPDAGPFDRIETGGLYACGFRSDGSMECWGYDRDGRIAPLPAGPNLDGAVGVSHNCALLADGSATCWGYNLWGQADPQPGPFVQIEPGFANTCALDASGDVTCWGNGGNLAESVPGPFEQIFGGSNHFCGLRPEGSLECWGSNLYGQSVPRLNPFGDPPSIDVTLDRATAWRTRSKRGRVRAEGTVRPNESPFDPTTLVVTIRDGQDLLEEGTFTSCKDYPSGTTRCQNDDRSSRIRFIPVRSDPGLYRYKLDYRRRDISAPQVAPLEVEFAQDGALGSAQNEPCRVYTSKLVCKGESGPTSP